MSPWPWLQVMAHGVNLLHDHHVEYGGRDATRMERGAYLSLRLER